MSRDVFADREGNSRVLFGCSINSGSPRLAELAARVGFDVVWIEMEHGSADLASAEAMGVSTELGGGVPLVRAAGWRREHILHALEIGGQIIVVPMVNDADTAREVVQYGKFPPLGVRGYNTRSRAARFGLGSPAKMMQSMNESTILMPQIETTEAAANIDAILAVEGLDGIFVGPGDLSASLGYPGDFNNLELGALVCDCIRKARSSGRHAGILAGPGALLDSALAAGADLCIIASDMGAVIQVWRGQLDRLRSGKEQDKSG